MIIWTDSLFKLTFSLRSFLFYYFSFKVHSCSVWSPPAFKISSYSLVIFALLQPFKLGQIYVIDILINVVLIQSIIQQWSLYVIYFELQFEMKKRWKNFRCCQSGDYCGRLGRTEREEVGYRDAPHATIFYSCR